MVFPDHFRILLCDITKDDNDGQNDRKHKPLLHSRRANRKPGQQVERVCTAGQATSSMTTTSAVEKMNWAAVRSR